MIDLHSFPIPPGTYTLMDELNKCERACLLALEVYRLNDHRLATIDEITRITGYEPRDVAIGVRNLIRHGLVSFHPDTPLTEAERKLIYDDP